jgi:hypothetical protein
MPDRLISIPYDICVSALTYRPFFTFLQLTANRIAVGHLRYGPPNRRKKYMTRLKLELEAYENTGNMEHLLNISNYAFLESEAPQNHKFHFDPNVDSVTRKGT